VSCFLYVVLGWTFIATCFAAFFHLSLRARRREAAANERTRVYLNGKYLETVTKQWGAKKERPSRYDEWGR
jgi:Flp pilus assembly protein TadB